MFFDPTINLKVFGASLEMHKVGRDTIFIGANTLESGEKGLAKQNVKILEFFLGRLLAKVFYKNRLAKSIAPVILTQVAGVEKTLVYSALQTTGTGKAGNGGADKIPDEPGVRAVRAVLAVMNGSAITRQDDL